MKNLRQRMRLNRLLPLATVLVGIIAAVLAMLGQLNRDVRDGVIITLLALLAVDTLIERIGILEKIEAKLDRLPANTGPGFQQLEGSNFFRDYANNAKEISLFLISGRYLFKTYSNEIEKLLKKGCTFRIILVHPDCAVHPYFFHDPEGAIKLDVMRTLTDIKRIAADRKEKCKVRFSKVYPPATLLAANLRDESGIMMVTFHLYKSDPNLRPFVLVREEDKTHWYEIYKKQFEQAWEECESDKWNYQNYLL